MSKNDITGDTLISRPSSETFRMNWDKLMKNDVHIKQVDGYVNIIIHWENNQNNFLRLSEEQFRILKQKINEV